VLLAALAPLAAPERAVADEGPAYGRGAIWAFLAERYDGDRDGRITPAEYDRGAARFRQLDEDEDGVLTPADFRGPTNMDRYVAKAVLLRLLQADADAHVLSRDEVCIAFRARDLNCDGRWSESEFARARGAFRSRVLGAPDMPAGVDPWPHVLAAADRDGSRTLDTREVLTFFDAEDTARTGRWSPPASRMHARPPGPAEGERAPAFTLSTPDGVGTIALSSLRGKPAVLAFGSWT
jgi:hypothetical protein